jgi:hypothetical protein
VGTDGVIIRQWTMGTDMSAYSMFYEGAHREKNSGHVSLLLVDQVDGQAMQKDARYSMLSISFCLKRSLCV